MTAVPFASFAQNGEDVVLWRALGHVEQGRYVDVGANHPTDDSVTRAFYDAGWSGVAVEPVTFYADLYRQERPRDVVAEVVATGKSGGTAVLHEIPGTGLSTLVDEFRDRHSGTGRETHDIEVATSTLDDLLADAGWDGQDIHFVSIDTEGSEAEVLAGFDLVRWRPWVLVIEATAPDSNTTTFQAWEHVVTDAGYQFCLFDGLSRFYVSAERAAELAPRLTHGACILDNYSTLARRRLDLELDRTRSSLERAGEDLVRWRAAALSRWSDVLAAAAAPATADVEHLRGELHAMRETVSWRVTKPLRAVRGHIGTGR